MGTTLTRTATNYLTVDHADGSFTFAIDGPAPESHDLDAVYVTADDSYGGDYRVSWLVQDPDASPFEFSDESDIGALWSGCFIEATGDVTIEDLLAYETRYPGRVAVVSLFSNGGSNLGRASLFDPTDFEQDEDGDWRRTKCSPDSNAYLLSGFSGVHLIPEDVPEEHRQAWVDGVWEEWTSWANGDVWGVVTNYVTADLDSSVGAVVHDDAVWGFTGRESAEEAAASGDI